MALLYPAPTETRRLQAFCGQDNGAEAARGNACQVSLLESPPAPGAPPTQLHITHCQSWPTGACRADVACYTADGRPITVCGHGLLCSAKQWLERWNGPGTLVMRTTELAKEAATEVACRAEDGRIWLGFQPLPLHDCEVPRWTTRLSSVKPHAAAIAGASDGYLVLEWPENFPLNSLAAPTAQSLDNSERALIVTCEVSPETAVLGERIQYRYFAPQYGVNEDPATGSAMRVLSSYWQQTPDDETLTAYQCSKEGGLLFSRVEAGTIWVGGWTSTHSEHTTFVQ